MTTATLAPPRTGMPRWLRMAGWYLTGHLVVLGGLLALAVPVAVIVLAVASRSGPPQYSAMQVTQQIAPWVVFGVSIHYALSWLGPQLAAGMTRRDFIRATVLADLAAGVTAGLAVMVLLGLEHWIYGLLGWSAAGFDGRALAPDAPFPPYLWGLFLLIAAGALSGTIVGLTYARLGAIATFLLPLTVLPLIAVALTRDPATMFAPVRFTVDGDVGSQAALGLGGAAFGLAVLGVAILAVHLLARRIPVRGPRA